MPTTTSPVRRFELDWLRVLAIILVFAFHTSRFFDPLKWMGLHLWYLELLFVYSLIFLPLFLRLRKGAGRTVLAWLGDRLAAPGAVYLLAPPIMLLVALPSQGTILGTRSFGGWSILGYIPIFLNGFLHAVGRRESQERTVGQLFVAIAG